MALPTVLAAWAHRAARESSLYLHSNGGRSAVLIGACGVGKCGLQ